MAQGGRDLGERDEDETAREHAGMGDLQFGRALGLITVQENVDIDEAWSLWNGFLIAHAGLDLAEGAEQRKRVEFRFGL